MSRNLRFVPLLVLPPVEPVTWPLWLAPLLLPAAGGWLATSRLRRRR